jgi:hypothetical protein
LFLPKSVAVLPGSLEGVLSRLASSLHLSSYTLTAPFNFSDVSVVVKSYLEIMTKTGALLPLVDENSSNDSSYSTRSNTNHSVVELTSSALQEQLSDSRFLRHMNCVFKYDFKVGNYLPDDAKKLNPHLFSTIKDITTGIKKSS